MLALPVMKDPRIKAPAFFYKIHVITSRKAGFFDEACHASFLIGLLRSRWLFENYFQDSSQERIFLSKTGLSLLIFFEGLKVVGQKLMTQNIIITYRCLHLYIERMKTCTCILPLRLVCLKEDFQFCGPVMCACEQEKSVTNHFHDE